MTTYEDDIVILLRKICTLALPKDFDASEDTNRQILLEKIMQEKNELYSTINDFLTAFDSKQFISSDYQLRLKAPDVWKMQNEMFDASLQTQANKLKDSCKTLHISIDYELSQLWD